MVVRVKPRPSALKGEGEFHLDERTKKAFANLVKKAKKEKLDPHQYTQTIICGEAEFRESEKGKKTRN